jgi:hypothetical protein
LRLPVEVWFSFPGSAHQSSGDLAARCLLVPRANNREMLFILARPDFDSLRQQLFATVRMLSRMVQNLKTRAPRKTRRNQPGYTTRVCNLRVRQASIGPRSARNNLLVLSTHRRPKRSLAKCAGSRRAWHSRTLAGASGKGKGQGKGQGSGTRAGAMHPAVCVLSPAAGDGARRHPTQRVSVVRQIMRREPNPRRV